MHFWFISGQHVNAESLISLNVLQACTSSEKRRLIKFFYSDVAFRPFAFIYFEEFKILCDNPSVFVVLCSVFIRKEKSWPLCILKNCDYHTSFCKDACIEYREACLEFYNKSKGIFYCNKHKEINQCHVQVIWELNNFLLLCSCIGKDNNKSIWERKYINKS